MNYVYQIEGFSAPLGLPEDVEAKAKAGTIELYNSARPIPGHELHEGEFRHGIFYAVLEPAQDDTLDLFRRIVALDGHLVLFISQAQILEEMQRHYDEFYPTHGIKVEEHPIKYVINSWLNLQREQE